MLYGLKRVSVLYKILTVKYSDLVKNVDQKFSIPIKTENNSDK